MKGINIQSKKTKLKVGNKNVLEKTYSSKKKLSPDDVNKLVSYDQKILNKQYPKKNIKMMVAIDTPLDGWMSGKSFSSKGQSALFLGGYKTYDEWEHVNDFVIYFWEAPKEQSFFADRSGGCDGKYNNCLVQCIYNAFGVESLPKKYQKFHKFKKQLGLKYDEKIHINMIPEIEENLKIKINVSGDYEHISNKTYQKSMSVILRDGHYSFDVKANKNLVKGISTRMQKPIVYKYEKNPLTQGLTVKAYNGEKYFTMSFEEKEEIYRNVHTSDFYLIKCKKNQNLKCVYDEHVADRNQLFEQSNEEIDLYKCNGNFKKAGLKMLFNDIKHIEEPEEISKYEEPWLENSVLGALVFGKKTNWMDGYVADKNTAYLSAMMKINIPVKQGTFYTLTETPEFFRYGIYRCKIIGTNKHQIDRLFTFNHENSYTHYDLEGAKLLGMTIEMIQDGNPNFLSYQGKYMRGRDIFGKTINRLYEFKSIKVHKVKDIMTSLWGGLCQEKKIFGSTSGEKEYIIPENSSIRSIIPTIGRDGSQQIQSKYTIEGELYLYKFARMKPFLLSYCRLQMIKDILPHNKYVVRCATDSITSTRKLDLKYSDEMGDYKMEYEGILKVATPAFVWYMNEIRDMTFEEFCKDSKLTRKYFFRGLNKI